MRTLLALYCKTEPWALVVKTSLLPHSACKGAPSTAHCCVTIMQQLLAKKKKMLLSPRLLPTAPLLPKGQQPAASLLSCFGKHPQGKGTAAQKGSETPEFAGDIFSNLTSFQRTAPSSHWSMQSPGTSLCNQWRWCRTCMLPDLHFKPQEAGA